MIDRGLKNLPQKSVCVPMTMRMDDDLTSPLGFKILIEFFLFCLARLSTTVNV